MNRVVIQGTNGHDVIIRDQTTGANRRLTPEKSLKAYNHSPSGFSWGYGGSGPAQLALAILMEFTDTETALKLHQEFKWEHVSAWEHPEFLVIMDVARWIRDKLEGVNNDEKRN